MCKFTICIPSYNRAHTIQKPLESLVEQTFKDFEVVVVDDGSSDFFSFLCISISCYIHLNVNVLVKYILQIFMFPNHTFTIINTS